MINYFGIGLDAKMCLDFHKLREKHPYLFKSSVTFIKYFISFIKISNKFIYGTLGTDHLIMGKKMNLSRILEISCDNHLI